MINVIIQYCKTFPLQRGYKNKTDIVPKHLPVVSIESSL